MVLLFNQAQLIILALIPNITNKVVSSQTGIRHNLEDNWSKVTFPTTSKSVAMVLWLRKTRMSLRLLLTDLKVTLKASELGSETRVVCHRAVARTDWDASSEAGFGCARVCSRL